MWIEDKGFLTFEILKGWDLGNTPPLGDAVLKTVLQDATSRTIEKKTTSDVLGKDEEKN